MNRILSSRVLLTAVLGLLLTTASAIVFVLQAPSLLVANKVAVAGPMDVTQKREVFRMIAGVASDALTIGELKVQLESASWIARVAVERRWPDGALVTVRPELPIALWNDDAFLNDDGDVFQSPFVSNERLPQLYGPVGSEKLVMDQFRQLNNALFKVEQGIAVLRFDERGGWAFETDAGLNVSLGKTELLARVQRLLRVVSYISMQGKLPQIEHIDSRYGNGVAVRWIESGGALNLANNDNSKRELKL